MLRSIRVRLTAWYILIFGLIFTALAAGTYTLVIRVMNDETATNMAEMAANFEVSIKELRAESKAAPPSEELIERALEEFTFRDYRFAIFTSDGRLIGRSEGLDALPVSEVGRRVAPEVRIGDEQFRVVERPLKIDSHSYRLFVYFSLADQMSIEARLLNSFLIGAPILLLLAGAGGYLLARQSLKPIALMGERARQIDAENLHERLPVANPKDEVGGLATLFNQLLDRLDQEFERQRRFMADASHELRTPLAIVRGESEVALQKTDRTPAEYQESLRIVNDEGKRLSKIVEDLFTLARVDSGDLQANFREVYVDELLHDCVTRVRTLSDKRNIKISTEIEEVRASGDEDLLRRLFLNLLDNAVKYNIEGGRIKVVAKDCRVSIANTGPEISEESREAIFERFFRVDKAHSRQAESFTSGAGLGLAIARWIAEMHHASLELSSSADGENIFILRLLR